MNEIPQPNPIKNEFRQLVPVYALGLVIAYFASMQFVTQIITPEAIIKGSADADHYLYKGVVYNCFIWIVLLGYCYKYMPFKSTEQINVKRVFLNIIFGYLACIGVMFAIGLIYQFIGFEPETQAVAERIKNASSTNIYLIILL